MSRLQRACQKTKLCRFFEQGKCARGGKCGYAHAAEELRSVPDLRDTKCCPKVHAQGFCDDASCSYAHQKNERRQVCLNRVLPRSKQHFKSERGNSDELPGYRGAVQATRSSGRSKDTDDASGHSTYSSSATEVPADRLSVDFDRAERADLSEDLVQKGSVWKFGNVLGAAASAGQTAKVVQGPPATQHFSLHKPKKASDNSAYSVDELHTPSSPRTAKSFALAVGATRRLVAPRAAMEETPPNRGGRFSALEARELGDLRKCCASEQQQREVLLFSPKDARSAGCDFVLTVRGTFLHVFEREWLVHHGSCSMRASSCPGPLSS